MRTSGTVVVHADDVVERGRIVDLSADGLLFALEAGSGPVTPGDPVRIELRLDGTRQTWLHIAAQVVRTGADGTALRFLHVPDRLGDLVQEETLASLESARSPHVILVDPVPERRANVARALRKAGCDVRQAQGPLEALAHLDDSRVHPWVIAIADTIPEETAVHLREYLQELHPEARMVVVRDEASVELDAEVADLMATRES